MVNISNVMQMWLKYVYNSACGNEILRNRINRKAAAAECVDEWFGTVWETL